MVIYILKSSACLAIFFLFYKLFLEKENMHFFKRFYLLVSLIAAFSIPFITFTNYVFVAPIEELSQVTANNTFNGILVEEHKTDYLAITLWTIYGLGVLLFGLKFSYNLWKITNKIRTNVTHKTQSFINVLLVNLRTPHTFFNYIFLNKHQFELKKIPLEVIVHEQTHAKQKHTLDILFIELLQIAFWFNPFIYIIKHAIKLNHEFLADEAVLRQGFDTSNYQNTLLRYTSKDRQVSLANAINYSFIKKRFTIMKTHTSRTVIWLRGLVLLPLLTILIYGFSEKVTLEKLTPQIEGIQINETKQDDIQTIKNYIKQEKKQDKATPEQIAEYNKLAKHYNALSKGKMVVRLKDVKRLKYIYGLMTTKQKKAAQAYPNFPPPPPPPPASIESKKDTLRKLEGQKTGWVTNNEETLYYVEKKGVITYYNRFGKRVFPGKVTSGKGSGEEFNITVLDDSFDIEDKEKIPPPPPTSIKGKKDTLITPTNPKKGWITRNGETYYYIIENGETQYFNRYGFKVDEFGKVIPLPPLPNNATSKQKRKHKKLTKLREEQGEEILETPPPPPPGPPNPLDHIIDMAKKGAIFYHEGKKVSSDKAITIVKKNRSINIEIIDHDSKKPTVKLSKKPITIKNK